jgi:hypothetical protein
MNRKMEKTTRAKMMIARSAAPGSGNKARKENDDDETDPASRGLSGLDPGSGQLRIDHFQWNRRSVAQLDR